MSLNELRPSHHASNSDPWHICSCKSCQRVFFRNQNFECAECGGLLAHTDLIADDLPEEPVLPRLAGAVGVLAILAAVWVLLGG